MIRPILATLVVVCLCMDAIGTAVLTSQPNRGEFEAIIPYAAGFGFLLGQFTLLINWGVLGNEPLSQRLPRAVGLGVFLFYAWCLGMIVIDEPVPLEVSVVISLLLVLLFLLLSAPFWLLNRVFYRRIMIPGTPPVKNEQFRIVHILTWTTAIALLTTVGKFVVGESEGMSSLPPIGVFWQFGVMVLSLGCVMAALSMPLLFGTLAPNPKTQVWIAIGLVYLLGPPLLHEAIYMFALGGTSPTAKDRMYGIVGWYAFFSTMTFMIVGALLLVRFVGYRLVEVNKVSTLAEMPATK